MKQYYDDLGHDAKIYTTDNLCINNNLFKNDFFILKSKKLIYLYAGFFLKENNIHIYPDPYLTFKHKYRIEAYYLIKQAGLISPLFYVGNKEALKNNLKEKHLPLVSKSLMDSGSKDVKIIRTFEDLKQLDENVVYFEQYIKGIHYIIYFIENEISVCEKPPLSDEHAEMNEITPTRQMKEIIKKWRETHNIKFGHLDVIKEELSGKIFVVDPGNFPEFTNWRNKEDPCPKICSIIMEQVKQMKNSEKYI